MQPELTLAEHSHLFHFYFLKKTWPLLFDCFVQFFVADQKNVESNSKGRGKQPITP